MRSGCGGGRGQAALLLSAAASSRQLFGLRVRSVSLSPSLPSFSRIKATRLPANTESVSAQSVTHRGRVLRGVKRSTSCNSLGCPKLTSASIWICCAHKDRHLREVIPVLKLRRGRKGKKRKRVERSCPRPFLFLPVYFLHDENVF